MEHEVCTRLSEAELLLLKEEVRELCIRFLHRSPRKADKSADIFLDAVVAAEEDYQAGHE
jgi:hypothetical protein